MHYLPQCYLKEFALAPSKKSKLFVFDMKKNIWFQTTPLNVGAVRDFNRVKLKDLPPDAVEKLLSTYEAKFAHLLENMRNTFTMPCGDDFDTLMAFIALIAIRNPLARANHNKFQTEVITRIMDLEMASKDRYEATVKLMKEKGVQLSGPEIPYEEIKRFYDEGEYEIKIENTLNVVTEMKTFPTIAGLLAKRKWTLVVAGKTAGYFLCCDHPVSLSWTEPKLQGGFYPPGFALPSTEVVFPVTKKMALIGTFEGDDRRATINAATVASINSRIILNCDYQIYAPHPEFYFLAGDNQIHKSEQLKDFLRRVPEEEK